MGNLTKMIAKDGEGATKLLECTCTNAPSQKIAIKVAKSVVSSSLVKSAMFGSDANWGRILCAVGYTEAKFDINKVEIQLKSNKGIVTVCENGVCTEFSEGLPFLDAQ